MTERPLAELCHILSRRLDGASDSIVLVLGAGASLESGRPAWRDKRFIRDLVDAIGSADFIEDAFRHLPKQLGPIPGGDFAIRRRALIDRGRAEHLCALACRSPVRQEALIRFLIEKYFLPKEQTAPQLGYELIAHLVKHRVVDHVVTLNFDEVLDAALEDELGPRGYSLVLPDSPTRGTAKLPHLFKLHGTISQPQSLRFFVEDVGMLSDEMTLLLNERVFRRGVPTWIISLGYSWDDLDLVRWISTHAMDGLKGVFSVDLDGSAALTLTDALSGLDERLGKEVVRSIATKGLVVRQESEDGEGIDLDPESRRATASVDEVLWAVWREIASGQPSGRVPGIARHLLLSHFFPPANDKLRDWPHVMPRHDSAHRFEAEVLLTAGKTEGFVTLSSVARDSRVFRHWAAREEKAQALDSVPFLSRSGRPDVTEVFFYSGRNYSRHFEQMWTRDAPLDHEIHTPQLVDETIVRKGRQLRAFLRDNLQEVLAGPGIEVDPGEQPRTRMLFSAPDPLRTYRALRDETDVLLGKDWSTLLVVAESGRWLQEVPGAHVDGERQVLLIEASAFGLAEWKARKVVEFDDSVLAIGVPWWVHNRHMTLCLDRDGTPIKGIYFRRRQRSPRISPVSLYHPVDLRELVRVFLSYATRFLEEFAHWSEEETVPTYPIDDFVEALFRLELWQLVPAEERSWHDRLKRAVDSYAQRAQSAF